MGREKVREIFACIDASPLPTTLSDCKLSGANRGSSISATWQKPREGCFLLPDNGKKGVGEIEEVGTQSLRSVSQFPFPRLLPAMPFGITKIPAVLMRFFIQK